ncbi:hypothetical protein [Nocardia brasiliensis]|uniref:hypothetical protein n=1 Tax=Nocardia brasiliensis TaxID=37326 RepID=UPI0024553FE8|nr:hypothetical protein [Nocardia brasiliensis]
MTEERDSSGYSPERLKPSARLMRDAGIPLEVGDLDETELSVAIGRLAGLTERVRRGELEGATASTHRRLREHRFRLEHRLGELLQQRQMNEIKDAVEEKVADPAVRQELSGLVSEFAKQQQELTARLHERETAESQELRRVEVQERRWRMRKSMLEREPAAVLIGGLLLLILTGTLIVGMFTSTEIPEILGNSFLLILGFFFGQTTHRGGRSDQPG